MDDTEANRYVVARWLQEAGFRVVEAARGAEALALAPEAAADLVILDIHLPDVDGFEVARRLKADARTAHLPVLHLSAERVAPADRAAGLEVGADGYLTRPVEPAELIASVRALLRLSQSERALREQNAALAAATQEAQAARRAAERAAARMARLQTATAALARAGTAAEAAAVILAEGTGALGAAAGAVFRLSADGTALAAVGERGVGPALMAPYLTVPLGADLGIAEAARTGGAVLLGSPAARLARYPHLADDPVTTRFGAWAALPLQVEGRVVGSLSFAFAEPRTFGADDRALLTAFADQCAQALERARLADAERAARAEAERAAQLTSTVATHVAEGVCLMDAAGRLTYMNPAAERLLGWTEGELLGEVLHDRVHHRRPDGRPFPKAECPLGRVLEAAEPVLGLADQWIRKDGAFVHVVATCAPVARGEQVVGAVLSLHDDTARRAAEAERERLLAELQAANAELRAVTAGARRAERQARFLADLGQALQPLTDPDGLMATAARLLGEHVGADRCAYAEVEADEDHFTITGNHTRGDTPSIVGRFAVADFGAAVLRLMRENAPYVVEDAAADPRVTPPDRAAYEQTQIRAIVCVPLHKAGRLMAMMAVHQRVSRHWAEDDVALVVTVVQRCWESLERARALRRLQEREAALAASERQFRTLADAIPTLAWTARADGYIDWYNARWYEYTGTAPEQMEGWRWQSVHDPAVLPTVLERWQGSVATGEPFEMTFPLRGADGVFRPFLTRVVPLRDADGRVTRWIGTNTDVSAEREARAAAEAANRAKGEFLAVMSHELRTPLNAIGGYAELLEMGIRGPVTDQQREDLGRIQRSQRHLLGLVNEVLNYAKLETGTVRYDAADVMVCDALAEAEGLVAPQARAKGLALAAAECPADVAARADPEKLRQVLVNLLSNAVKFTDPGGRVSVACAANGGRVRIAVADTGIGIAPDQLERVFEPFVQVRADLTRTAEGTGLGLAISRDLARGMGGELTVESTLGAGSIFAHPARRQHAEHVGARPSARRREGAGSTVLPPPGGTPAPRGICDAL